MILFIEYDVIIKKEKNILFLVTFYSHTEFEVPPSYFLCKIFVPWFHAQAGSLTQSPYRTTSSKVLSIY